MKKIVLGVLCALSMCLTSCGNICEDAYFAEIMYKDCIKRNDGKYITYKNQFMDLWWSMDESEREEYKAYRAQMEEEAKRIKEIDDEAIRLLNE